MLGQLTNSIVVIAVVKGQAQATPNKVTVSLLNDDENIPQMNDDIPEINDDRFIFVLMALWRWVVAGVRVAPAPPGAPSGCPLCRHSAAPSRDTCTHTKHTVKFSKNFNR